jgi:hypothetical protein
MTFERRLPHFAHRFQPYRIPYGNQQITARTYFSAPTPKRIKRILAWVPDSDRNALLAREFFRQPKLSVDLVRCVCIVQKDIAARTFYA